jgi:hypothetical protein
MQQPKRLFLLTAGTGIISRTITIEPSTDPKCEFMVVVYSSRQGGRPEVQRFPFTVEDQGDMQPCFDDECQKALAAGFTEREILWPTRLFQ